MLETPQQAPRPRVTTVGEWPRASVEKPFVVAFATGPRGDDPAPAPPVIQTGPEADC